MTQKTASVALELKHFKDGDAWMLAEDIPQIDFFFCQIWLRSFVNNLENSCGRNYSKILAVFEGPDMKFYYGKNDCLEFTRYLVKKIASEPEFGDSINKNIILHSDRLQKHAKSIPNDLVAASNTDLWQIIHEHTRIHTELYEWGWLSNATDMFYPEFTNLLKAYLRTKCDSEEQVNTYFVTLTSPDEPSAEALQHKELLELAAQIENDPAQSRLFKTSNAEKVLTEADENILAKINEYSRNYKPMGALWISQPFSLPHYVQEISEFLKAKKSPSAVLTNWNEQWTAKKAEKERLFNELEFNPKYRHLFRIFSGFMLTKFYRRYAQLRSLYAIRRVFEQVSKRFNLDYLQARMGLTQDYEKLLVHGTITPETFIQRKKFCVSYSEKGSDLVLTGNEAQKLAATAAQVEDLSGSEIFGQCACTGKAQGEAKIILSAADMYKMNAGDILVAIATNPDVVPAMKKASAIITEQGGVTCHAAIVSRELGIPCVIGTKIATKWLKDGDEIEVDATKGIVRKL